MINKKNKKIYFLIILLTISLCSLGMNKKEISNDGKIFKNIYIENVNVEYLSIKEAKNEIIKNYPMQTIHIEYNEKKWDISPEDIGLDYNIDKSIKEAYEYTRGEDNIKKMFNLSFKEPYIVKLHASYNEAKLSEILIEICKEINIGVVQATINIKDSSQVLTTDSKKGIEVEIIKLKEAIYDMIDKKNIKKIELPINIIEPKVKTEDVKSVDTILGQYSTSFYDHSSRGSNIHVAAKSTSDILLMPGEIFSYNKTTGARTWSNGYKSAKVIVGGKYVNGEGGGVCQVSTTIYNAALLAGMEIKEVHNHTFTSHYAPRGKDAAVSYGYTDFKFRNPYSHPIYIKNISNNGSITSKIYGCSQDRERIYIRTEEKYDENKIDVKTYRIYLNEENKKIIEELIAQSKYKIK
ncbi:MAG: VanW family protein [Romboutsia sp.]|uniref:VanW family protein n=1 Tax=Romboutsia sp. TaxID=1965302 RepID=UPI003F3214DD